MRVSGNDEFSSNGNGLTNSEIITAISGSEFCTLAVTTASTTEIMDTISGICNGLISKTITSICCTSTTSGANSSLWTLTSKILVTSSSSGITLDFGRIVSGRKGKTSNPGAVATSLISMRI